jgi:hypothetical protein
MRPNQALPEGICQRHGFATFGTSSVCPEESITRSVILIMNERGTLSMASISFGLNNKLFSVNLFRYQHIESYQCRIPIYREPVR